MAKVKAPLKVDNVESWEDLRRFTGQTFDALLAEINGRLQIVENCYTSLVSIAFSATNTDTQVAHTLGVKPTGWILVSPSAAMQVYQVADSTDKTITLRSSATGSAQILVFR